MLETDWQLNILSPIFIFFPLLPMAARALAEFEARRLAEEVQAQRRELHAKDAELESLKEKTGVKLRSVDREALAREAELEKHWCAMGEKLRGLREENAELRKELISTTEKYHQSQVAMEEATNRLHPEADALVERVNRE